MTTEGPDAGRSWIARWRALDTPVVSDALDALGLAGVARGVRRVSTLRRVAGRVVTVQLAPAATASRGPHLGVRAIEAAGDGEVVVVANEGRTDAAAWGGLLSLAAGRTSISGVVIDGMCRDVDEALELDFPVFARGAVPSTARGRFREVATNEPVRIAGIAVAPGDLVVADGSGVVFVPAARADDVLTAAERIAGRERAIAEDIAKGRRLSSLLGQSYERMLEETGR